MCVHETIINVAHLSADSSDVADVSNITSVAQAPLVR